MQVAKALLGYVDSGTSGIVDRLPYRGEDIVSEGAKVNRWLWGSSSLSTRLGNIAGAGKDVLQAIRGYFS